MTKSSWAVNPSLVNEIFETWRKDPHLLARTERHTLSAPVYSAYSSTQSDGRSFDKCATPRPMVAQLHRKGLNLLHMLGTKTTRIPHTGSVQPKCVFVGADLRIYEIRVGSRDVHQLFKKHSSIVPILGPPPVEHAVGGSCPTEIRGGASVVEVLMCPDEQMLSSCKSDFHAYLQRLQQLCLISFGSGDLSLICKHKDEAEQWHAINLEALPKGLWLIKIEAAVMDPKSILDDSYTIWFLAWAVQTKTHTEDEVQGGPRVPGSVLVLSGVTVTHQKPGPESHSTDGGFDVKLHSFSVVEESVEPPQLVAVSLATRSFMVVTRSSQMEWPNPTKERREREGSVSDEEEPLEGMGIGHQQVVHVAFPAVSDTSKCDSGRDEHAVRAWTLDPEATVVQGFGASCRQAEDGSLVATVGLRHGPHACLAQCALVQGQSAGTIPNDTDLNICHVATASAFAHVVSGKPRRKFVLLDRSARVCAVVESERYTMLYEIPPVERYMTGSHLVVDSREESSRREAQEILGAQFIEGVEDEEGDGGGAVSTTWLALLHRHSVRLLKLRTYDTSSVAHVAAPELWDQAHPFGGFMWSGED